MNKVAEVIMEGAPKIPEKEIPAHRRVAHPQEGFAWNPLRDYPVNARCFCGSGKKAKKCCLPKQPMCVAIDEVAGLKKFMADKKSVNWETNHDPKDKDGLRRGVGEIRQAPIEAEPEQGRSGEASA